MAVAADDRVDARNLGREVGVEDRGEAQTPQRGDHLAVLLLWCAARILVHVETVQARRQAAQVDTMKDNSCRCVTAFVVLLLAGTTNALAAKPGGTTPCPIASGTDFAVYGQTFKGGAGEWRASTGASSSRII